MAKLEYDEKKIESALGKLNEAKDALKDVSNGMVSGLNIIARARGSSYLDTNALREGIQLPENCTIEISNMIDSITNAAEEILKYNGDVSKMNFLERSLGTLGMIGSKAVEGVFTAGEQLVDGFASLIGWGAGLLGFKDVQKSISNFVKKDYVGDAFQNFYYKTGLGQAITKSSYIKEDGKIASFTKGIGTAIGYAGAIYLSGGLAGVASGGTFAAGASAASSSLAVAASAAGVGGLGGTMQAGLGMGMSYNDAFKVGVRNGLISAGTVVVLNQAIKGISNKIQANKAKNAGTSLEPTGGPTGTSGGPSNINGLSESGMQHVGDSFDDLANAAKTGQISYDDAIKICEENFKNATSKADMVQWHPDKMMGELHTLSEGLTKYGVSNSTPLNISGEAPAATNLPAKIGETPAATNLPATIGETPAATNLTTNVVEKTATSGVEYPMVVKESSVPAVIPETPTLPTVTSVSPTVATAIAETPVVTSTLATKTVSTSNLPAVVSETPTLPAVTTQTATTSNLPAVVAQTETLPAVVNNTPGTLTVVSNEVQLPAVTNSNVPAVINDTSNVPAVITETAEVPAVVTPIANVSTPVVNTPVIPVPPYTDPGTMPPTELKMADLALNDVATTPIVGTPSTTTGGGTTTGGTIGGGTVITTPTTPATTPTTPITTPVTVPVTTPTTPVTQPSTVVPTEVPEYAPIPDTMAGKKGITDYIAPAIAGAALGVAGAVIANKKENYSAEYLDKNDEDDEESHDYDDDDFFDKVEE